MAAVNLAIPQPVLIGLLWPKHSTLLNFMGFSHWMASLPSTLVTTPHHTTQLAVIRKLEKGALSPTVHAVGKDVEQFQCQDQPWRNITHHCVPLRHWAIDWTLCVCPSSQFLRHQVVHLSNPCLSSLETRIPCSFSFCRYWGIAKL